MSTHAKILNVDGREPARSSRTRALRHAGFEVREAGTGGEALTLASTEGPGLVLLADDLPDTSGFDVCRRLKASPPTAQIPVVLLSDALAPETDRIRRPENCADRYLTEPTEPGRLVATVKACLRTQRTLKRVRSDARRWAATFNAMSDGVILLNPDRKIVRCNRSFAQLAGQPIQLLVGQPLDTVLLNSPIAACLEQALQSGARETLTCSIGDRWFRIGFDPVFGNSGALAGTVCIFSDITERKQTEDALQEANQRLSSALSSFADAYFALDFNWRLLEANGAAEEKIFKRPTRTGNQKAVWEEYPESLDAGSYKQCQIALAEWKPVHFEAQSTDAWFEANAYPRKDRIEVYLRDISDRRRAEEDRAQCLVREQEARKEAEVANRLKDDFLAMVSHEMRTPLNSVIGWTALLRAGKLDEAARTHALEIIERNAETQAKMVDDLLDAALIVSGKFRLDLRQLDLDEVIVTAVDALKPAASAKNLQVQTVFDRTTAIVSGDRNRLQQILWNLLSNSIKFTPKGGRIEVRLTQSQSKVKIMISDTGIGIKSSLLPHIFDRFRQGDRTPMRPQAGLGLGLAIARTLVELHGGAIAADSVGEGQGATFTILLPLAVGASVARTADVHPALDPSTLKGLRILVVDDEPDTVELLVAALTSYGGEIITAASAAEARDRMRMFTPDVLVSDLKLPGENGCDLISSLRSLEHEQGKRLPAIALTASGRPEDRRDALLSGFNIHVNKPVAPDELAAVILKLTRRTMRAAGHA